MLALPILPVPLLVIAIALAGSLRAQGSAVIPPSCATQEGNSLDGLPFGADRARLLHYVDNSLLTAVPSGALLKAISYRRDGQVSTPTLTRTRPGQTKFQPIWYLRLNDFQGSVFSPSPAWPPRPDQGGPVPGWTTVIRAQLIDFPDLPLPASGIPDFDLRLPFDQPLQYGFTGPGLGIDHFTYRADTQVVYQYFVDAVQQTSVGGTVQLVGPNTLGCPAGQNRATGIAPDPGGTLAFTLYGLPSTLAWAQLASAPTLLDLTMNGMPGCAWYLLPPLIGSMTATNSAGIADLRLPVPASAAFAGASLLGQWVAVDPRVNPDFALATSDGLRFTIGSDMSNSQVLMSTLTNSNAIETWAFITTGRGLVFELEW